MGHCTQGSNRATCDTVYYLNTEEHMIRTYRPAMLMLSALSLGSCAMNGASSDGMSQQKSGSRLGATLARR
jgi:hypothetical protein